MKCFIHLRVCLLMMFDVMRNRNWQNESNFILMHIKGTIKERNTLKRYPLKGNMNRSQVVSHDENRERGTECKPHMVYQFAKDNNKTDQNKRQTWERHPEKCKEKSFQKNREGDWQSVLHGDLHLSHPLPVILPFVWVAVHVSETWGSLRKNA